MVWWLIGFCVVLWLMWCALVVWGPDMVNALVRRAKRTPYSHLDGYMNRWWLVPFNRDDEPGCGPVPFLKRPIAWVLQRLGIAVRIHEILRSDIERHPHNHPWPYITVILRGGYMEERYDEDGDMFSVMPYTRGRMLLRSASSLHKLWLAPGTTVTTLFITFRKSQSWGFLVNRKIVPWREYLGVK